MQHIDLSQASVDAEVIAPVARPKPDLPPVIPSLLECNDPPTDDERLAILARLIEVRREFEKWRPYAWTPFTPSELTSIPKNLSQHAIFLDQHYHIISGIRILPGELLEHILFLTLPVTKFQQAHQHANWHAQIYRLMKVCRKWRYVVFSSPRFWSYLPPIRIAGRFLTEKWAKRVRHPFDFYRDRSGEHPVVVELSILSHPTEWEAEWLAALISLAPRWESANLDTTWAMLDKLLPCITLQGLPNLREFRLLITNYDNSRTLSEEWTPLDLESKCPLLCHVSLVYVDKGCWDLPLSDLFGSLVKFPLSRLTEFDEEIETSAGTSTIRHFRPQVSRAVAATGEGTLRLERWVEANDLSFFQRSMSCYSSHVVSLNLVLNKPLHASASILASSSFSFPLLTDLTIVSDKEVPLLSLVLNTVRLSQCSLLKLSLHVFEREVGHLATILTLSPELQHLRLTGIPPEEDLLRMKFDPTLPSAVVAPKLEILEIEVPFPSEDTEATRMANGHALTDMVRSRVDLIDPAHRTYIARVSATVKTWDMFITRDVYDQLERNVASPDRELSTEEREHFELTTVYKWETALKTQVKQETLGRIPFLKRDYSVEERVIDGVVKEMEEYQIEGSDVRLLLVRFAGYEDQRRNPDLGFRSGIFRPSWIDT